MRFFQHHSLVKKIYILFTTAIIVTLCAAFIFYVKASHMLQDEKAKLIENTVTSLVQNTNDIAASVMLTAETISNTNYANAFLTEKNASKKLQNQQSLNRLISKIIKNTAHVKNILLIDNLGNVYSFSAFDYSLVSRLDRQYHIFSVNSSSDGFSGAYYLSDTDTAYYVYLQTIYDDYNISSNSNKIGTCLVISSTESLAKACNNTTFSKNSLFAVLDSDHHVLASNLETDTTYSFPTAKERKDLFFLDHSVPLTDWEVICSVPYSELYSELFFIRLLAIILISILLLAFLILIYQIRFSLLLPLQTIVGFLTQPPYYLLHNHLEETGDEEMTTLTVNINKMLDRINDLTHTVLQNQAHMYEVELSQKQSQLLALQTQINPHFLYNTLNCIQGLAYQKKFNEICTTTGNLSFLMRYNIKGGNLTTVKEEFDSIEKYLQIIDFRFPQCFQFRLHADESIQDCEMPRFLLQPLVENSILHGLKPKQNGTLSLTARLLDHATIQFECKDDGVGIPSDRLKLLKQELADVSANTYRQSDNSARIGLINVHQRIQLMYGSQYGLSIESFPEGGVTMWISIPVSAESPSV